MDFGQALHLLKNGRRVTRDGWNGKSMFLYLVKGSTFEVTRPPLSDLYEQGTMVNYHAHIDIKSATNQMVPWTASQADLLSDDWVEVV